MIRNTSSASDIRPGDVIYFTADWCSPCRQLKPQYARASVIDADRTYHVINIENCDDDLIKKYAITSVPHIFYISEAEDAEIMARKAEAIVESVRILS